MNNQLPSISVVMPNLNGARHLGKALDSFLCQDYPNKQLVVVDGRSTDESHQAIEKYSRDSSSQILWVREPDSGISDAINKGIAASSGSIVGYLGSDDILYADVFKSIAYHASVIDFDAIYFNSYTYNVRSRTCILRKPPIQEWSRETLLHHGTIVGLQNIYFRRHVLAQNSFDITNRSSMDYEYYLRIIDKGYMFCYVDRVGSINIFDGNISSAESGSGQVQEAIAVTLKYKGDYSGPLWCDNLLDPATSVNKTPEASKPTVAGRARDLASRIGARLRGTR